MGEIKGTVGHRKIYDGGSEIAVGSVDKERFRRGEKYETTGEMERRYFCSEVGLSAWNQKVSCFFDVED